MEGYYKLFKGKKIHQENLTILDIYASNTRLPKVIEETAKITY